MNISDANCKNLELFNLKKDHPVLCLRLYDYSNNHHYRLVNYFQARSCISVHTLWLDCQSPVVCICSYIWIIINHQHFSSIFNHTPLFIDQCITDRIRYFLHFTLFHTTVRASTRFWTMRSGLILLMFQSCSTPSKFQTNSIHISAS